MTSRKLPPLLLLVSAILLAGHSLPAEGAFIYFRWTQGTTGVSDDRNGVDLTSSRTVLTFLTQDTNVTWSGVWDNGTDNTTYGADIGGGDSFLFATNSTSLASGTYQIAGSFRQDPSSYAGYHAYFVIFDYSYASFLANSGAIPNGTDYDILPYSFYILSRSGTDPSQLIDPSSYGITIRTDNALSVVPEPTTFALIATGMGVILVRRRKKQATGVEESA